MTESVYTIIYCVYSFVVRPFSLPLPADGLLAVLGYRDVLCIFKFCAARIAITSAYVATIWSTHLVIPYFNSRSLKFVCAFDRKYCANVTLQPTDATIPCINFDLIKIVCKSLLIASLKQIRICVSFTCCGIDRRSLGRCDARWSSSLWLLHFHIGTRKLILFSPIKHQSRISTMRSLIDPSFSGIFVVDVSII